MAVEMQTAIFALPGKFEKLRFFDSVSTETMSTPSTPSTPICTPPIEAYSIKPITDKDTEQVLDHLRRFFFRDEPLNIAVNLLEDDDATCIELEEYSLQSIKEGRSLMAVSTSGKVVGVCLNGVDERNAPEEDDEPCPNPKFAKILKLLETLDDKADVFGKFPDVDSVMNTKILSVDGTWRGRGIAKQLVDKTIDIAREQGHALMRMDCSSHFSAKAVARLGFECIYTLKYSEYEVDGEVVFKPEHPHTEACVYVLRINGGS